MMGAFIVNINVRTQDRSAVETELQAIGVQEAWVTGAMGGWITIYEEKASTQDDGHIREMAGRLSSRLHAPTIAFLVHDSDLVCYWLYDDGRLLDEFNSCPDYFDRNASPDDSPGQPEVLLRYCRQGTTLEAVAQVLNDREHVFAEDQLVKLADLLGINADRVHTDYRYVGEELGPSDLDATFVGTNRPEPGAGPSPGAIGSQIRLHRETDEDGDDEEMPEARRSAGGPAAQLMQMLGMGGQVPADPLVQQLVEAAGRGDVAEIDRLLAAGAAINGQAPLKPNAPSGVPSLMGRLVSGGVLGLPVTPLLAALANKRAEAARRLIEKGADLNFMHPILGTAVHAAAGSGDVELLRLALDRGGNPNATNAQGITPLKTLEQLRLMLGRFSNLGALNAMLGKQVSSQLEQLIPSAEALEQCAQLLRERGAK